LILNTPVKKNITALSKFYQPVHSSLYAVDAFITLTIIALFQNLPGRTKRGYECIDD
jgi:hypothetical protein